MSFLYQIHIKTFSLDIMYHEEQIQHISPTKLANKHVTTNKFIFNAKFMKNVATRSLNLT